jgi:Chromo (CHRromatin Organisation MOdifier) domain
MTLFVDVDRWGLLHLPRLCQGQWEAHIVRPNLPSKSKYMVLFQCLVQLDKTEIPFDPRPKGHERPLGQVDDAKYDIKCIVEKRTQYRVRYSGCSPEDDEWATAEELSGGQAAIDAYERQKSREDRRSKRSQASASGRPEGAGDIENKASKRLYTSGAQDELPKRKRGRPRKVHSTGTEE